MYVKVFVYTLGCKVNLYESEFIINELKKNNFEIVTDESLCDIYIINTCTVTNNSDSKSRKIIRHARKVNEKAVIVALGCFVEANKDKIMSIMPEIYIAVGNKYKSKIVSLINKYLEDKQKIEDTYLKLDKDFEDMYLDTFNTKTRAFVKVQDGCENFCSYCIIPRVRGKCRSKNLDLCIKEVNMLVQKGFKEVVLTGIHTGNDGKDINTSFATLLKELIKIDGLERLRISSIEATELTEEVLDVIKNSEKIVNHFHVPIQSGCDKVLKIMNRKYNIEEFKRIINKLRECKKDVSITTDIITGHPGEDEDAFEETVKNVKEIGFSKLHVFPYSIRKNTKAEHLVQIKDDLKKKETKVLLDLSKKMEMEYMNKFVGKELSVLVERNKDGTSYGHTTNYLEVKINKELPHNEIVTVKITGIDYPYCIAEI